MLINVTFMAHSVIMIIGHTTGKNTVPIKEDVYKSITLNNF